MMCVLFCVFALFKTHLRIYIERDHVREKSIGCLTDMPKPGIKLQSIAFNLMLYWTALQPTEAPSQGDVKHFLKRTLSLTVNGQSRNIFNCVWAF